MNNYPSDGDLGCCACDEKYMEPAAGLTCADKKNIFTRREQEVLDKIRVVNAGCEKFRLFSFRRCHGALDIILVDNDVAHLALRDHLLEFTVRDRLHLSAGEIAVDHDDCNESNDEVEKGEASLLAVFIAALCSPRLELKEQIAALFFRGFSRRHTLYFSRKSCDFLAFSRRTATS